MAPGLCVLMPMWRIFPCCLGVLPDRDQLVGNGRHGIPGVHVPDVQVVRAQFLKAGVELRHRLRGGLRLGLAGEHDLVAHALQRGPHHALVVALLVPARGVEIGDAHVDRPGNHAAIGRNHAPVADRRDLEPGLAQRPVADRRGPRRRGSGGLRGGRLGRRRVGHAGDWKAQPGHEEVSTRGISLHDCSPKPGFPFWTIGSCLVYTLPPSPERRASGFRLQSPKKRRPQGWKSFDSVVAHALVRAVSRLFSTRSGVRTVRRAGASA